MTRKQKKIRNTVVLILTIVFAAIALTVSRARPERVIGGELFLPLLPALIGYGLYPILRSIAKEFRAQ